MKPVIKLLVLGILVAPLAHGQDALRAAAGPVVEAGGGYAYVDTGVPEQGRLSMNGILLTANADVTPRFGIAMDLGYVRNPNAFNAKRSADLLTYMAGPAFYPVRKRNMNVYTHLLFGGARETGVNFGSDGQVVVGYANEFAWAAGGGLQYRWSRSVSLRLGADYLHTSFFNPNVSVQGQSGIQLSACLIYTFGGRER